ncbi:hypothetical protein OG21DRAFT_1494264 [Imleria badia]|nr:hypothetical protein OG21DRAFT_1494264 [Imleria badia]
MLWSHPERNVTVAFDNSVLTIGLSAFLQAFYTLYTVLLVFVTQRLALTDSLSRSQKLTATHDVSGAWAGIGAATATLWQQTKIAASTRATLLVFLYLSCISILHVASPTIMEFQPYNATSTTAVPSNATWPGPSVNLTTLNMAAVGQLVPLMSSLSGLSTDGLINSTLYDTFSKTPQMVNATVNATAVRANCGLLPNLTYTNGSELTITASMSGVGEVGFIVSSYEEVSLLYYNQSTQHQSLALAYLVSTGMDIDGLIGNNVTVHISVPSDGQTQNIWMTAYVVACSLEVSNHEYTQEIQNGYLGPTVDQPDGPSQAWSLWTPPANDLGTQLNQMVSTAITLTSSCPFCAADSSIEVYLTSLLGVNVSLNAPVTLTPNQFENAISQLAAQLIWTAGQFGENGGGFTHTASVTEVTEQVPRWRLNIQIIPVVFTFSASFILLVIVYLMLGVPSKPAQDVPLVEGTSVLEMLWVGAHISSLRKRLKAIGRPSPKELRSGGMFDVYLAKALNLKMQHMVSSEFIRIL